MENNQVEMLLEAVASEQRPWGSFRVIQERPGWKVKEIYVIPGGSLSLQRHLHRSEHWTVVRGTAKVTVDEEEFLLPENKSCFIPINSVHRLENPGLMGIHMIEVQVGSYLGEDDIERFSDAYGREIL